MNARVLKSPYFLHEELCIYSEIILMGTYYLFLAISFSYNIHFVSNVREISANLGPTFYIKGIPWHFSKAFSCATSKDLRTFYRTENSSSIIEKKIIKHVFLAENRYIEHINQPLIDRPKIIDTWPCHHSKSQTATSIVS